MQMMFVDESSTPPPIGKSINNQFFVLGGLIIPEDFWGKLEADLNRLKKEFKVEGEIKWRYFAPQKSDAREHSLSHLSYEEKDRLRQGLYQAIRRYRSVRIISVVAHAPTAYTLSYIQSPDDLYWYCYKQLTERFQYYLQDLERTVGQKVHGIIVCDHRAPKDDERLRSLHHQLLTGGKHTISIYKNLIEGLFIAPSHLSVGVQYADMVAGAVYRYFSADDTRFIDQIKESFRTSPNGNQVDGFGLVKFPKTGW